MECIINVKDYLKNIAYPGRGIITGITPDEKNAVFAYFITGRSENSRNRIFVKESDNTIRTEPYDKSKIIDPSLIIYNAVKYYKNNIIVSNGDHTDTIYEYIEKGKKFEEALNIRTYEPDCPNFTPRISALLTFSKQFSYKMSIIKISKTEPPNANRLFFDYKNPKKGTGHIIHTYKSNGNPLPSFDSEPVNIITDNSIDRFTNDIWTSLDENNKISLIVKYIDLLNNNQTERILNKRLEGK